MALGLGGEEHSGLRKRKKEGSARYKRKEKRNEMGPKTHCAPMERYLIVLTHP